MLKKKVTGNEVWIVRYQQPQTKLRSLQLNIPNIRGRREEGGGGGG